MKNRIDRIMFSVFSDFIVHVEITSDIQKSIKKYPHIADLAEKADADSDGVTVYDEGQICYIFLKHDAAIGTIAHEAFHAVENMLKHFGVDFEGETPAYHIGYLVNRAFKFLRKR
jgi:hypothetical protein